MNYIDNELLTLAIDNNIIDLTKVREMVETMNRKKIEEQYNKAKEQRKVWKGEGKDQRWKFKKADGSIVAKTTEEAIKKAYIEYHKDKSLDDERNTTTFSELYSAWLEYKKEQVGTNKGQLHPNTYRRYQRDYERYIKGTSFDKQIVSTITPVTIEKFLKNMVITHNLTQRCFTNIHGYLGNALFYARKRGLLNENPMDLVDKSPIKGFCKVIVKEDKDRVLSASDMNKLINTLHDKQVSNDLYVQNYAIELATLTGMRVGELAALKWNCIEEDVLRICYSEHRIDYEDKACEYYIGEPKNRKHRAFPMSDEIKTLLNKVKTIQEKYGIVSEYVFANKEGRVNSHTISCAMSRRCKDAGIDTRSIHAIRRTVSSHLRAVLPVATVANMLGHLEETNNKHYNYDIITDELKATCLKEMYKTFKKVA